MSDDKQQSLAEAAATTDPRKTPVPGATAFVPQVPAEAPEYLVVRNPYYDGRYFEIGERCRTNAPIKKELGSPGLSLQPLNHKGPWPPTAYVEAEKKAQKKAREEWIRDLIRGM